MVSGAPDTLRCPHRAATLGLQRAWPRDDGHLLCEYAGADGTPVAAQWFADRDRLHAVAAATPGEVAILERDGVLLQPGGADRRLRALRALAGQPGAALLVHRPERRAVVREADNGTVRYVKIVRPQRAAALAQRAGQAAHQASRAFRTPALCAFDHAAGTLAFEALAGRSLFALRSGPDAIAGWAAAGRALARLHDASMTTAQMHRAGDEAALTERWLRQAAAHGLLPPVDAARPLAALRDGPAALDGLLHRDLHDKQLLHHPGAPIGLLDTDTLATGERALDVANLLVHLELRVEQGRLTAASAAHLGHVLLEAYRPDPETRRRLRAYATAARLRLAAVYAFRPRWRPLARRLLATAVAAP